MFLRRQDIKAERFFPSSATWPKHVWLDFQTRTVSRFCMCLL